PRVDGSQPRGGVTLADGARQEVRAASVVTPESDPAGGGGAAAPVSASPLTILGARPVLARAPHALRASDAPSPRRPARALSRSASLLGPRPVLARAPHALRASDAPDPRRPARALSRSASLLGARPVLASPLVERPQAARRRERGRDSGQKSRRSLAKIPAAGPGSPGPGPGCAGRWSRSPRASSGRPWRWCARAPGS